MGYSLLIADDEPLEREALEALLRRSIGPDDHIIVAGSGTEAAHLSADHPVDIAFLDIRMPGMSGLEVAALLRERYPAVHLVFVSAYDYFSYAREAISLRAEDYLIKPVDDETILRVVNRLMHRGKAGTITDQERLQEAERFLEFELMDDLVQGEPDQDLLQHAMTLLEVGRHSGHAVVIRPDLDTYSFRLDTDSQRRTVVLRLLRAVKAALQQGAFRRVMIRAWPAEGFLLCFRHEEHHTPAGDPLQEDPDAYISEAVARHCSSLGISASVCVSPPFGALTEISALFRRIRREDLREHGVAAGPRYPGASRTSTLRQHVLSSVLRGDAAAAVHHAGDLWLHLEHPQEEALPIIHFLHQSLAVRGAEPRDTGIIEKPVDADLRGLQRWFLEEVRDLCTVAGTAGSAPQRRIHQWLVDHHTDDVGLPDLATHMGLSPSHCSRLVSREMGMSFSRCLTAVRLGHARRLLEETDIPVHQVAENAGFRDPNYFSRVFATAEGMTPGEYRRRRA